MRSAAEELLAKAEATGALSAPWQEPTLLRARWRDAGYAAAWPAFWDAAGDGDAGGGADAYDGWAAAGCVFPSPHSVHSSATAGMPSQLARSSSAVPDKAP